MTTRTQRDSLRAQLLDTRRMEELAGEHPLMSQAFREREDDLQQLIDALPLGNKEARTVLFFSGEPVQGALGIDAGFASRVLEPFQNLRSFLEVIAKAKAGLRLETGDTRCTIDPARAGEAYERVAAIVTDTREIQVSGVFKGMLLESWRFDFVTRDGHKISGKIDDDLTPERAAELNRAFFNLPALATLDKTTVLFKNGRARTTYTLKGLAQDG